MPPADDSATLRRPPRTSFLLAATLWIVAALGVAGAAVLLLIPRVYIPAEDAVILFQFSRNLAHTGAITYIAHGPHAEGATDFAWMLLIALGIRLHIDPFWFVAFVNVVSLFLLGALLVRLAFRRQPGGRLTPLALLFIAGAFTLLPQFTAAATGFSTLPFAVLLVSLAYAFLEQNDTALPLIALVLCLFRPDGVVFAVPFLVAALWLYPARQRRFALDLGLFVLPGIAYFLWRWHYFGRLLPLPFLVKADTPRWAHLIVLDSAHEAAGLVLFAAIVLALALRGRMGNVQNRAVLLCLVVLPNLFYFAMRLDQDAGRRFFVYLPVGVAVLLAMNWPTVRERRGPLLAAGLAAWFVFVLPSSLANLLFARGNQQTNRVAIAEDLDRLPHGTLLATEAGIAPYYSNWPSYDAWGLNTDRFAVHLLQPSDVAGLHPDLILGVAGPDESCLPQSDWATPYQRRTWTNMARNLMAGAQDAHYDLRLLPLGNPAVRAAHHLQPWQGDHECWLIRPDSPLHDAIAAVLTRHGALTYDEFAAHNPPQPPATPATPTSPTATHSATHSSPLQTLKNAWHFFA